jgi:hypothetical protein
MDVTLAVTKKELDLRWILLLQDVDIDLPQCQIRSERQ